MELWRWPFDRADRVVLGTDQAIVGTSVERIAMGFSEIIWVLAGISQILGTRAI